MMRQIFAAEINFEDTPLHVREKFNDSEDNIRYLLQTLRPRVEEVYILATRYRFTAYVVHDSLKPLTDFFHSENNLKGYVQFYYNTGESVTHLMATASGLLSPVKGEGRILTELIQGYQWASSCGCIGIMLDHTLSKAIETGKVVRTQSGIDKFCASVVETGLELLYDRLEDLHNKNFLILGSGELAAMALEYLTGEGMRNIAVAAHEPEQARQLAAKFQVKAVSLESAGEYFANADVVIGVSLQELALEIPAEAKKEHTRKENYKTKFILDFGIPPNFDARTVEMYSTEFYNLDDLRRMQPSPLESFGGLEAAWRMVMRAAGDFVHLLQLLNHSPVLTAYLTRQFTLKNGALKIKPKRTLRNMLLFRKSDQMPGISGSKNDLNAKAHTNNHLAEDSREAVKSFQDLKKFKFYFSEN